MNDEYLTKKNFILFAVKHYNKKHSSTDEFYEDIRRLKYIKKLISRYLTTNELQPRLILNHLIILTNCFGPHAVSRILFLKLKDQMPYLKPFMLIHGICPKEVHNIENTENIYTDEIVMNEDIINILRKDIPYHILRNIF